MAMLWAWFERRKNKEIVSRIVECFNDVDWSKHTFTTGGVKMETANGDKVFYPSREIDAAIERLNAVLKELGS